MKRHFVVSCAASKQAFLSVALGLTVLLSLPVCEAGPMYAFPKNVEPKITTLERKSGLRLTKKEWVSLQIQTTVWEVAEIRPPKDRKLPIGELAPVLTIVKQRALGIDRRFDYVADSGLAVTIEHPMGTAKSITYSIEKADSFLDAFRFTENEELEALSDDEIDTIKRYRGASK